MAVKEILIKPCINIRAKGELCTCRVEEVPKVRLSYYPGIYWLLSSNKIC
jgi:hypothetical protein